MRPDEAFSLAERHKVGIIIMLLGDDAVQLMIKRYDELKAAWDVLVPSAEVNAPGGKGHKKLQEDAPDVWKAWVGKSRPPTPKELGEGKSGAQEVTIGYHQFIALWHSGKATLAQFEEQIATVNALLVKYKKGAGTIDDLPTHPLADALSASREVRALREELAELRAFAMGRGRPDWAGSASVSGPNGDTHAGARG